jgi:sortase A
MLAQNNKLLRCVNASLVGLCVLVGAWQIGMGAEVYLKSWLAESLIESAWSRGLKGEPNPRPWPWADTWPVAKMELPEQGVSRLVLAGDDGTSLAFGPGLNTASHAPGEPGVTLISGHRDTHFRFLKDLREGHVIRVETQQLSVKYEVLEAKVVDQRFYAPRLEHEQDVLMLVTCYPFDALAAGGDLRFVVTALALEEGKSELASPAGSSRKI